MFFFKLYYSAFSCEIISHFIINIIEITFRNLNVLCFFYTILYYCYQPEIKTVAIKSFVLTHCKISNCLEMVKIYVISKELENLHLTLILLFIFVDSFL